MGVLFLGIVIRGETSHYELVTNESIQELDRRIKSQKGIEVLFSKIKNANHFFKNKRITILLMNLEYCKLIIYQNSSFHH